MYQRSPRLVLVNLDSPDQESLRAQFNPNELALTIKAVWQKTTIPGMSHTLRQFSHTDDLGLKLDLYFRVSAPAAAVAAGLVERPDSRLEPFTLDDRFHAESFLFSLCVPRGDSSFVTRNSPPKVLVVWPEFLSFEAIINDVDFKYTGFNVTGEPTEFTASLSIEEMRDLRYTSLDARLGGFQRSTSRRFGGDL